MNAESSRLFLIILILSSGPVFSEEESNTEAGALCVDDKCPAANTPLQALGETANDQMCKSMKSKPECKGVEEKFIKGCVDVSGVSNQASAAGKTGGQCAVGLYDGAANWLISMHKGIKGMFSDDDDPGLKAYLHAEFESASQDSGVMQASLDTTGAVVKLIYDATADVYSCLNPVGLTRKICQLVGNAPFSAITGLMAGMAGLTAVAYVPMTGALLGAFLGSFGLAMGVYNATDNDMVLAGGTALAGGLAGGALFVKLSGGLAALGSAAFSTPMAIAGTAPGAIASAAVTHDLDVQERIKERMKTAIEEFKKQEESQAESGASP